MGGGFAALTEQTLVNPRSGLGIKKKNKKKPSSMETEMKGRQKGLRGFLTSDRTFTERKLGQDLKTRMVKGQKKKECEVHLVKSVTVWAQGER